VSGLILVAVIAVALLWMIRKHNKKRFVHLDTTPKEEAPAREVQVKPKRNFFDKHQKE